MAGLNFLKGGGGGAEDAGPDGEPTDIKADIKADKAEAKAASKKGASPFTAKKTMRGGGRLFGRK